MHKQIGKNEFINTDTMQLNHLLDMEKIIDYHVQCNFSCSPKLKTNITQSYL